MKIIVKTIIFLLVPFILVACGASSPDVQVTQDIQAPVEVSAEATPTPSAAVVLTTDYPDAVSLRNQLAYGSLKLEDTGYGITAEQAKVLLPLWQAVIALTGDETTAEEELTAVQNQISEAMTPEQLETIAAMQITNADLSAFYAENGITFPTPEPGVTRVPGSGKDLSTEEKEAKRATAEALGTSVGSGSGTGQAARTFLFEAVVELLSERSG